MKLKFLLLSLVILLSLSAAVSADIFIVDPADKASDNFENSIKTRLENLFKQNDLKGLKPHFDIIILVLDRGEEIKNFDQALNLFITNENNELKSTYYIFLVLQIDKPPYTITNIPIEYDFLGSILAWAWKQVTPTTYLDAAEKNIRALLWASAACGVGEGQVFVNSASTYRNQIANEIPNTQVKCKETSHNKFLESLTPDERSKIVQFSSSLEKTPFENVLYFYSDRKARSKDKDWDEVIIMSSNKGARSSSSFKGTFDLLLIFSKNGNPVRLIIVGNTESPSLTLSPIFKSQFFVNVDQQELVNELNAIFVKDNFRFAIPQKGYSSTGLKSFKEFFNKVKTQKINDYVINFYRNAKSLADNTRFYHKETGNYEVYEFGDSRSLMIKDNVLFFGEKEAESQITPSIGIDTLSSFEKANSQNYKVLNNLVIKQISANPQQTQLPP